MPPITEEKKYRFISRVYFGVSDNPHDDVNPYSDLNAFLQASVGDLRWGQTLEVRQRSKIRFASNFSKVLYSFYILLSVEDAWDVIQDDQLSNEDAVKAWVQLAIFEQP